MSVLFVLLPVALAIAALAIAAYVWASRHGQFDDLTTPAIRAAFDDDDEPAAPGAAAPPAAARPAERQP